MRTKTHKGLQSCLVALLAALLLCGAAEAKNGDVVGHIYSTDIRAFINGIEVPSYNIGGRTVVVVEDVLDGSYAYNDSLRTLLVYGFDPANIRGGKAVQAGKPSRITGRIYETDIKTCLYDAPIESYNLNGKTAVAIEDLGADGEFNAYGGKYVWDPTARTISLEFLYDNLTELAGILAGRGFQLTGTDGVLSLRGSKLYDSGFQASFEWREKQPDGVTPLSLDGETVGYHLQYQQNGFVRREDGSVSMETEPRGINWFDLDKMSAAAENIVIPNPTREEVIDYWRTAHAGEPVDRVDTEQYSFLYMRAGTPHGSTEYLLFVRADGSWHNFANDLPASDGRWGLRTFRDVTIDKDNDAVYLTCGADRYVIDLAAGTLRAVDSPQG